MSLWILGRLLEGWRLGLEIFKKIRKKFSRPKTKAFRRAKKIEVEGVKVPKAWLPKSKGKLKPKQGYVIVEKKKQKKWHIPHLRSLKRGLAGILVIFNFLFSQFCLMSTPTTQVMGLLFLANSFIIADYLWKTRKEPEIFRKVMKVEENQSES